MYADVFCYIDERAIDTLKHLSAPSIDIVDRVYMIGAGVTGQE